MIRHIVMWTFADGDTKAADLQEAKSLIEGLFPTVPTLRAIEAVVPTDDLGHSHDLLLIADFDDVDGLATYQAHPAHVEVATFIAERRTSRAFVDYEV